MTDKNKDDKNKDDKRNGAGRLKVIENALSRTKTETAQIIVRAEEAEKRINILRGIQKCVDSSEQHDWGIAQVTWKNYPFEIEQVHIRCANCVCSMFVGQGEHSDNKIFAELDGLDVPLEEYLIPPEERDAKEGEE
jgi:hypothetical protein